MHDSAVAAWGVKGWYDYPRPVSVIRYLAGLGQRTDPNQASYHPDGINLHPGFIEVVTTASTAAGERHEDLAGEEGKIAVFAWRGPDYINDPAVDVAGCGWILAENWWPYQRPTFVTPPFAGYVSGHSTFSRARRRRDGSPHGVPHFLTGSASTSALRGFLVARTAGAWSASSGRLYDASDQCSLAHLGRDPPPADTSRAGRWVRSSDMTPWTSRSSTGPGACDGQFARLLDRTERHLDATKTSGQFCTPGVPNTGLPGALACSAALRPRTTI